MNESLCLGGRSRTFRSWHAVLGLLLLVATCIPVADAAFVEFTNCLSGNIVDSDPQLLQFVPLNVSAVFDLARENQPLNITVYGNVTGKATDEPYPPPSDPSWNDTSNQFGKIPDFISGNPAYTTLVGELNVLSYTPYTVPAERFCNSTVQGNCPLGPAFFATRNELDRLPAFAIHAQMNSTYSFTSISARLRILAGDQAASSYGCVLAIITPDLGDTLSGLLRYLPLAILIMVGVATIAAAVLSPWGSSDIFNWTSNFGRDEDLLRLVTPGFADCLQYLQFIVLTGSLTLNYPGFYQPVVSRVSWSALMFNQSLVSGVHYQPVVDGVYQYGTRSIYGLDRMTRLVGMGSSRDTWAGMILWLVIIVVAIAILTQVGFACRWAYRQVAKIEAEDLRSKNGPFTAGNCIRISLNYFLLPLASLSFYQLVIASRGPSYSVAIAVILMVVVILFSVRLFFLFLRTKPRAFLFDDLITVLAYGPLYNTYCDDAAMFALVPIVVNFTRGIAIGAVQPSGVAQIVVLAICEIVMILTLNAFRPFPSATSMNIYHTCFSAIRFVTLLLSIAFVPTLEVSDGTRGWIGYAILLIHACVLVFGFFLNAVQTLIEVVARLAGAGGHSDDGSATRGGLVKAFGMRQLSRRVPRRATPQERNSMASGAAMLERMDTEPKDLNMTRSRTRSISASSTLLLQQARNNPARMSQNLDGLSAGQSTPDASSTVSKRLTNRLSAQSAGGIVGLQHQVDKKDPYYRPPRRNTMDALNSPDKRSSADWSNPKTGLMADEQAMVDDDAGEGTSRFGRGERDDFEDLPVDASRPAKDYAVREVDFYYGVRGPALSSGTRKLKTGPADPTGTVSSATGWFKNLFGGKTHEKHKGFEVVRSARAPPPGLMPPAPGTERAIQEPYRDDPQSPVAARAGRSASLHSVSQRPPRESALYDDASSSDTSDDEPGSPSPIPAKPPSLPLINTVGDIELPSRIGSEKSRKSRKGQRSTLEDVPAVPAIPRKSSRRHSSRDLAAPSASLTGPAELSSIQGSPNQQRGSQATMKSASRLPFTNVQASPSKVNRHSMGGDSVASDYMHVGDEENAAPVSYTQHLRQTSSALGSHAFDDRPSSVGFVPQHRASDAIHHSPDSTEFEGSVAEVLGRPSRAR
ncbi:uncharacterized protein HMPREF1541_02299 [Cyphellophora europaea CBS 101466]|uniref:ML-like domain-containing protein n=1 Tax=Cyphellophora europaea (strain CBS 101466) TaxID=1220924 RepID=W2S349_CYPE1|nr:uncharacterized protein HMPREF1541_02299 [Cyphellophora europaea CBS 101466]ETN43141.1 hypothetical protein HMPREF1541_02299 [Cyphellophora europaea CBS 101466]